MFMSVNIEKNIHYQYSITAENLTLEILAERSNSLSEEPLAMLSDHTHPYLEIFACDEDSIQINSPEGIVTIKAGEAAIVPPNIPHRCLNTHNDDVWQAMAFFFRKHPLLECQDLYSLLAPFGFSDRVLVLHHVPELFSIIKELIEKYNSPRRMLPALHFLYYLCRVSEENKYGDMVEQNIEATHDSNFIRMKLLDKIINTEFMYPVTAEEVAQKLHISSRQLARIVKERYNKTLYQVIVDKRLNTSAEMLRTSDISAEKIAVMVGFSNKNSFWREFQKKYGVTPMEYRKL